MSQQQQPNQQVPDHRFQELSERLRKMEAENNQLRGTIDAIYQTRQAPAAPVEEKPLFQPDVDAALEKKIRKLIDPETTQLKQKFGYLVDENDLLKFQQQWGVETHNKYKDKIEHVRNEAAKRGQFITREDAYKHVHFEEHAKKPQPKPEAPKGPQYDPYLNRYVEPTPQTAQPPAQEATAPQAQTMTPPSVPDPAAELPPVGPVNVPTRGTPQGVPTIDLASDDKGLAEWESKYGDIPL